MAGLASPAPSFLLATLSADARSRAAAPRRAPGRGLRRARRRLRLPLLGRARGGDAGDPWAALRLGRARVERAPARDDRGLRRRRPRTLAGPGRRRARARLAGRLRPELAG